MRILIIGGTRFVGHAMAEAALEAGHDVTLLHRHETDELPGATHLLADRDGDLGVLADGSWDATIDVCAYVPSQVRRLHEALGGSDQRGGPPLFVSTVSLYREPPGPGGDEDSPLYDEPSDDSEEGTNQTYGPLKRAREGVAPEAYAEPRLAIARPTSVVGPRDATARSPCWPLRAARGGPMTSAGP